MLLGSIRPLAVPSLLTLLISGCATAPPAPTSAEPDCYAYVYFDGRYGIRGVAEASPAQDRQGPCYRFAYDKSGQIVRIDYRQGDQLLPDPVFGVATIRFRRSGGEETRTYLNAQGEPTQDLNGVYGVRLRYDSRGQPVEWRSLDASGKPIEAKGSGLAAVRWRHDVKGHTVEERYLGPDQRPKEDRNRGVARVRWIYDERGNTVEEVYFDPDDRPTMDQYRGVARVQWIYDEQGNVVEERYLGPDGRLTEDRHRGVAIVRWAYDRRGLMTEERYFGRDQGPKEDRLRKAATVRWVYDGKGRVLDTYLYDRTGAPVTTPSR
jgi:YD repeat-containing protein